MFSFLKIQKYDMSSSSSGGSGWIKFTGKHDESHETENKTHTNAPQIYTLMYTKMYLTIVNKCSGSSMSISKWNRLSYYTTEALYRNVGEYVQAAFITTY